jgi:membrane associated rhomboid family serine protease
MILPIGDFPNARGHVPVVTYLLIVANVAVYLFLSAPLSMERAHNGPLFAEYVRVMARHATSPAELRALTQGLTAYDLYVFANGFRPAAPSLRDLFFSMFLHGGFLHLAGNMLFLWIYGDNVEHRLGSLRYLLAYLGCGVAATGFHMLSAAGSQVPMVGASGAISGILGFYFVFFPRNQVRLLWLLPPFLMQVFEVPARLVLGIYLVLENVLPYVLTPSATGVAHGAHIGGFVAGLGVALVMRRRSVAVTPPDFAPRGTRDERDAAIGSGVRDALAEGRMEDAARAYFARGARDTAGLLSPDEAVALGSWLRAAGHDDAALVVLRRALRDHPQDPASAAAHLLAGEILVDDEDQAAIGYPHFLAVLDLASEDGSLAEAARAGLAAIEARQKRRIGTLRRR